jgi:hypothetical protein
VLGIGHPRCPYMPVPQRLHPAWRNHPGAFGGPAHRHRRTARGGCMTNTAAPHPNLFEQICKNLQRFLA